MQVSVYVDESGDLGWSFNKPYRQGGSSRYLTIAGILIAHDKRHFLKRLMKDLYKKTKTPHHQEVKWANLTPEHRIWIAEQLLKLKQKLGNEIEFSCITVYKDKVNNHIRQDANKLYNYMIKLAFIERFSTYEKVMLNIDQRSIKVASGNSLHDYLQTELWFNHNPNTILETTQCDSKHHLGVQLADIVSGIVQNHFEDGKNEPFNVIKDNIIIKKLFFERT